MKKTYAILSGDEEVGMMGGNRSKKGEGRKYVLYAW